MQFAIVRLPAMFPTHEILYEMAAKCTLPWVTVSSIFTPFNLHIH